MLAGSRDPLFDDWIDAYLRDPESEWSTNWTLVAARAKSLTDDSPECAAMVRAKLLRTHGPRGLKFRSLYQSDASAETSLAEIETRRQIERSIMLGSRFIDAAGTMSRAEFDWQMSWNAVVLGDAFAVRVWQDVDGIPTSTRWRIIHPARVCPPPDKVTDPKYAGGIEIDSNGRPAALWIDNSQVNANAYTGKVEKPQRVPWTAPDGTPNVVHKVGLRVVGSRRGLSEFAPIIMPARMLQGVSIAYVATKRVQASHPMLLHVSDVEKARQMYRGTRIENLLLAKDHQVEFPAWKFEGADYREFVDVTIRSLCAAWQLPWELVLGDHSAKSGASSRSLWQQHYQMAEREQAEYVDAVQRRTDESIVREMNLRADLGLGEDWWANMAGVYQGPPRVMPDPQKEIQWAEGMRALGMSRSTIMNRFGEDFRDEIMQARQDDELEQAQNPKPEPPPVEPPAPAQPAEGEDEPEDDPNATQEIDAEAMAMGGDYTQRTKHAHTSGDADVTNDQFMAGLRMLANAQREGLRELRDMMMARPQHTIHTDMRGEAIKEVLALMPPPVVNVQAAAPAPAPIVNVNPPAVHVAAPAVTVHAAAAEPSPVVVNVEPTPVTVENTVKVDQRPFVATPQRDGSVVLTPKG